MISIKLIPAEFVEKLKKTDKCTRMNKYLLIFTVLLNLGVNTFGQDWKAIKSPTRENITGIVMVTADTGYIVTSKGSCFKTTDQCQNWTDLELPYVTSLESLSFLNSANGWICGHYGTIFCTHDGGQTWQNQSIKDSIAIFFDIEMINSDTGIAIGIRANQQNKWAAVGVKTTDGGKSWKPMETVGMAYSEIRYVKPNHRLYFMSMGKLSYSDDGANNWTTVSTTEGAPARTFSIYGNTGIMAGLKGALAYSNDSGKTWFQQNRSEQNHLVSSVLLNPQDGIVAGSEGLMLTTSNGGRIWELETLPVSFFVMDLYAIKDRVYAVGGEGNILYKQLVRIKN